MCHVVAWLAIGLHIIFAPAGVLWMRRVLDVIPADDILADDDAATTQAVIDETRGEDRNEFSEWNEPCCTPLNKLKEHETEIYEREALKPAALETDLPEIPGEFFVLFVILGLASVLILGLRWTIRRKRLAKQGGDLNAMKDFEIVDMAEYPEPVPIAKMESYNEVSADLATLEESTDESSKESDVEWNPEKEYFEDLGSSEGSHSEISTELTTLEASTEESLEEFDEEWIPKKEDFEDLGASEMNQLSSVESFLSSAEPVPADPPVHLSSKSTLVEIFEHPSASTLHVQEGCPLPKEVCSSESSLPTDDDSSVSNPMFVDDTTVAGSKMTEGNRKMRSRIPVFVGRRPTI